MQYKNILFLYKREDKFSVTVAVNSISAQLTYHNFVFPEGTSKELKDAFLTEADEAVMKKLMIMDSEGIFNPWEGAT